MPPPGSLRKAGEKIITVIWAVAPCGSTDGFQCLRGIYLSVYMAIIAVLTRQDSPGPWSTFPE
jgi:hypothetical protein